MKILILLLLPLLSFGQKVDTIIDKKIYQSYFNYQYKEPIFVVYKLYKGGGDCNRSVFHFINDTKIKTATQQDYAKNGYDEGHLANAEDFANNCINDELTFRFYNCVPQTSNLNRGIWKHWETQIRKDSQKDSLLVIVGNIYGKKFIGKNKIAVPDFCFKIVQSLSTKNILYSFLFTNDTINSSCKKVLISDIENEIKIKLPLKK